MLYFQEILTLTAFVGSQKQDAITIFYFTTNLLENGILWSTAEKL
jgi:hypothetical protein